MFTAQYVGESSDSVEPILDFAAPRRMCVAVTTRRPPDSAPRGPALLPLLTEGQRDCLRLVYQHMTSKDIARILGVSPHTVDMRLRTAMKTLQVSSRIEAARLLVADEAAQGFGPAIGPDTYQPLVYQAPEIVPDADSATFGSPASDEDGEHGSSSSDPRALQSQPSSEVGPPASGPPRLAGASDPGVFAFRESPASVATAATETNWPGASALDPGIGSRPFNQSLPWGARNDLAIGTRLAWIFMIAVGSALAFGAILAALAALKALI